MNRKELESRLETFKEQQRLTSKAIEDTQKQLDDLDAEENLKLTKINQIVQYVSSCKI